MKKWAIRTGTLLAMVMLCALLPLSFAHAAAPDTLTGVSLTASGVEYQDYLDGRYCVSLRSTLLSWENGDAPTSASYVDAVFDLYKDAALSQPLSTEPEYDTDYYFERLIQNNTANDESLVFTALEVTDCSNVTITGYDAECVSVTTGDYYGKKNVRILYKIRKKGSTTSYPVWVGNTQVTEKNKDDILDDGGKAKYNPETNTLTLNNPSVSGTHEGAAIYADGDLTVSGSGSVTGTNYGIRTTGSCAITGGSLDISATDSNGSFGIGALEITISGGTVKAGAKTVGISGLKKTVISGGTVTATASNGTGIASPDLNISGGTVTAEGASSGMSTGSSPSSASFTGGTIKAIGSGDTGMPGMASGISFNTVEIGNSITSLTADGDYCAIGGETITIGSDLMIKEPENGKVAEQSGAYCVMKDDGTTIATHALIVPMATYEITTKHVPAGGGGFIMTAGPYYEGKQVLIVLNIFSGYDLDKMTVQDAHGNDIPVVSNEFIMPASDVTVTAYYKTDDGEYFITVTDDGNGTASASAATAAPGEEVTLSATPNAGYRFKEWQVMSGGITVTDNKFAIGTADVEIKAVFEEIPASVTYTVTFDANGHGTAPAAQTVEAGKAAAKPSDPAETGWIFDGWYREAACINAFDFSTLITDDITLYAKWTEEGITPAKITYMVTGGGNSTWIKDSNSNVIITVKRSEADETCFSHFSGVRIDGTTLAAGDYEAKSGSTVITLKAATLQKLSTGSHTVTINFDDGKAETKLTVKAAPKPTDVPKTGDSANFPLWLGLILLGLIGISVLELTAIKYRK